MLKDLYKRYLIHGAGATVFMMGALFAISHRQSPLFSGNQNTYLLDGIASAVGEPLASDWLANQTSNVPVFSWLTEISYKIYPEIFYVYHFCLAFILIFSLYRICTYFQPKLKQRIPTVLFFTSISFMNYIGVPILSGIAEQYILGIAFQPSAFGVFLLASVALFLHNKYKLAIFSCLIAAYFHPTYVLHSGILVFTYQLILAGRKNYKSSIKIGVLALITVFPIIYFVYDVFSVSPTEISSVAQSILVLERIPHHALLSEFWLSRSTVFFLFMFGMATFIGRDDIEFLKIIFVPFVLSLMIVLGASLTDSHFMMLLFGQRSSVWLLPILSAYVITRLCTYVEWHNVLNLNKKQLLYLSIVFMALLSAYELFNKTNKHFSHKSNQLFSVLTKLDYRKGVLLVPINGSDDIRLNARVPIFVDWKSHPYKAEEVIEWFERVNLARDFYQSESVVKRVSAFKKIQSKENISYILSDINNPISGCRLYKGIGFSLVYKVRDCNLDNN